MAKLLYPLSIFIVDIMSCNLYNKSMNKNFINIVEIKAFTKDFDKLVGNKERKELHNKLANNPEAGDLFQLLAGLES